MNTAERIILALSDAELLMWHAIGGTVPRQKVAQVAEMLGVVAAELTVLPPAPKPAKGPPIKFPERRAGKSCARSRIWHRRKTAAARRKVRLAA